MERRYYTVCDIMQILGISRSKAYKLLREWNQELETMGYITISGKISKRFVDEKIY